MATVTYTVKKGDTLSGIAKKYNTTVAKLVKLNDIDDPDYIVVGQKLIISGTVSTEEKKSSSKKKSTKKVTIKQFGLQADTDRTVYISWKWEKDHTKHYAVKWYYTTPGAGVWFVGNDTTTEYKQSVYSAPSNAHKVKVKIKPVSKTHKVNKKDTNYWTAEWSTEKKYSFSDNPPETPSAPTVTIEDYTLTAELNNLDVNATKIEFQIVKDDKSSFKKGTANIKTSHASYSCNVDAGHDYKVRARSYRDDMYSDWSEYSSNVSTQPAASGGITTIRAVSETSVYLEWEASKTAKTYNLEYTTKKEYFDGSNATTTTTGIEFTHYEITGLTSGEEYFFRVRAVNDQGESAWSDIVSIVIGEDPSAPTTWSSTTTVIVGEPLILYWVHNSKDGSSQTFAELELTVNGSTTTQTIQNTTDEDKKDKTSSYTIDTSGYTEGVQIKWRVRTAGIAKVYGEWSVLRTVDVYAPPTLELSVTNSSGTDLGIIESFPFYIYGLPGPNTQAPIGYHLTITANEMYETIDSVGNRQVVNQGEEVYSKYFDISQELLVEMSAGNIDLENNIEYTVTGIASMNSGLTAESSVTFSVSWIDDVYDVNAEIGFDPDTYSTYIRPYCEELATKYYKVNYSSGTYTKTTTELAELTGESVEDAYTTTGEMVFTGTSGGSQVYFCMVDTDESVLVDGVTLSVYRREFDGEFTEIATGLTNTSNTFVTDPHPALDYARYRVVAITDSTGAVSYYDVPGYPIGEPAVIIQWNEDWSYFDPSSESEEDELEQPPWSGSLLRLPYNIDVSDSNKPDVALIEYIGRKHPVSYYGTQIGSTATWNMDIDKKDTETIYALRRLARWMGDVYVREPSGSGYWANITVSFSRKHVELTMPITLNITRVEGGI